jgi:hypothetical protein
LCEAVAWTSCPSLSSSWARSPSYVCFNAQSVWFVISEGVSPADKSVQAKRPTKNF